MTTNQNEVSLLPCPFCGTPDPEYDNCDRGTGQWYACRGCPVRVQVSYKEDLKAAWNTRSATSDAELLDWAEQHPNLLGYKDGLWHWTVSNTAPINTAPTLRKAIAAAIAAGGSQNG